MTPDALKAASQDQVRSWSAGEGPQGLVFLRIIANKAAAMGRLNLVRHFIEERNVAVNTIRPDEKEITKPFEQFKINRTFSGTPRALAIVCDQEKVINYLLGRLKKEELETKGPYGDTCLTMAANMGNVQAARRLLEIGADLYVCSDSGHQPLSEDRCRALLKRPGNVISGGVTYPVKPLLCLAIEHDHLPVIKYLQEKEGREILFQSEIIDKQELFPLDFAARLGRLSIVEWLLAQGASEDMHGCTDTCASFCLLG